MRRSEGNSERFAPPDSHVRLCEREPAKDGGKVPADALDRFPHRPGVMNSAIVNTALARNLQNATLRIAMRTSYYGRPQPTVEARFPPGTHRRHSSAALQTLAAIVELATPPAERWNVVIEQPSEEEGTVSLDLSAPTPEEEARRGLEFLRRTLA